MMCLEIFILTTLFNSLFCDVNFDYYWRYYSGDIPIDAVPGGFDTNKNVVYIGQAYIINGGIIPTTIYPGMKSVMVGYDKTQEVFNYIKILCSSSLENFKWIPVRNTDFHMQMIYKHPVRGGKQIYRDGYPVSNIGRCWNQNEHSIGNIVMGYFAGAKMFYVYRRNTFYVQTSYEVLVYEPPKIISTMIVYT